MRDDYPKFRFTRDKGPLLETYPGAQILLTAGDLSRMARQIIDILYIMNTVQYPPHAIDVERARHEHQQEPETDH